MKTLPPITAGGNFATILKERWDGSGVSFIRACGIHINESQVLTVWKKRGVPARMANTAAKLLGCAATQISSINDSPAPEGTSTPTLSDAQEMLLSACEGLDIKQLVLLVQAAGWLKEGRPVGIIDSIAQASPSATPEVADEVTPAQPLSQTKAHQAVLDNSAGYRHGLDEHHKRRNNPRAPKDIGVGGKAKKEK